MKLEELKEHTQYLQLGLIYLDRFDILEDIKAKCSFYRDSQEDLVVYRFTVTVWTSELLEVSASLGNLILNTPGEAEKVFKEVVYLFIKTLDLLPVGVQKSQIFVCLRLQSLPAIKNVYMIENVKDLKNFHHTGRFIGFEGVIIGLSSISSYTQSTLYICPVEGCIGQDGKQYVRVHVPGASELQTIRKDFTCFHCGMLLIEDKTKRVLAEKITAEIVPGSVLRNYQSQAFRFQSIPVILRDDLVNLPIIGEKYTVYGLLQTDVENQKVFLSVEANNVLKSFDTWRTKHLSERIQSLYHQNIDSPWNFVRCLAYFFGESVTPSGSFYKLKLGILLSLVLAGSPNKQSCGSSLFHILACGSESNLVDRLFQFGCSLSERAVFHNSSNALTGRITKDHFHNSDFFLEGGSLGLAKSGICYLADLNRYKKSSKDVIKSTLDTNKVVVDVSSKFSQGLPQQHTSPLRCQIWAYSNPSSQKPSIYKDDLFITGDTGELSKALIDVFSLVFFTDASDSCTELEEVLTYEILQSSILPDGMPPILQSEDFQQYLVVARSFEVSLCASAEVLLQGYYQMTRRMRSSDTAGSCVPVSTLSSLYAISHAHAKLSLRTEVTDWDAVIAIYLVEECLTSRYGFSVLSVQPVAHLSSQALNLHQMDEKMYKFHDRLLKFCGLSEGDVKLPGHEE